MRSPLAHVIVWCEGLAQVRVCMLVVLTAGDAREVGPISTLGSNQSLGFRLMSTSSFVALRASAGLDCAKILPTTIALYRTQLSFLKTYAELPSRLQTPLQAGMRYPPRPLHAARGSRRPCRRRFQLVVTISIF